MTLNGYFTLNSGWLYRVTVLPFSRANELFFLLGAARTVDVRPLRPFRPMRE